METRVRPKMSHDLFNSAEWTTQGPGIREAFGSDAGAVAEELRSLGWRVYALSPNIIDTHSFFASIRATTPLDPPLVSYDNWDALDDSLRAGLRLLESDDDRIAIVWPRSSAMAETAPEDYEIARGVLAHAAESLHSPRPTFGQPKTLIVVLT